MEKNKIITSLTLAGILTAGVLGGNSNAASNSQGVCKNIISGESLVPYILENRDDFVTSARLKAEYTTASNLQLKYSDRVSTGDTFTTSTGKKTVLVYGDVNQDGRVTTMDASIAQNIVLGASATELQKAAADVRRNNNSIDVTTMDASAIQQFVLNGGDYVNVKPVGEKDEVVEEGYTLVVGDNNVINTENDDGLKFTVRLDKTLSEDKTNLTIRAKDKDGNPVGTSQPAADITAHTDVVELIALFDTTTDFTADGIYTFELVENEGNNEKILARTTVTRNTVVPAVAKVTTERTGWETATLSLENSEENGESKIAKIYYVVTTGTPTKLAYNSTTKEWEFQDASSVKVGTTYSAETPNGKLTNKQLEEKLAETTAYKVYYVVENTYGSRSTVGNVDIKDGTQTGIPEAVDKTTIKLPDLKKGEDEFSWTAKASTTYKVVVYKDGKIVNEDTVSTAVGVTTAKYDISGDLDGAGKYKIEIATAASASDKKDSAYVMSNEVEVKALNQASDIKFEVNQTGNVLTWKNTNAAADVTGYTVNVYDYNENAKAYNTTAINAGANSGKVVVSRNDDGTWKAVLTLTPNTAYRAEIIANPNTTNADGTTRLDLVASEKAEIVDFFNITPTAAYVKAKTTDKTVTLDLSSLATVKIKGTKLSNYRVEAYKAYGNHLPTEPEYVKTTCTSKVDGNNIIVSGLEQNTDYVFKLFASVNGKEGQSIYLKEDTDNDGVGDTYIKTVRTTPEIKNKTVVKADVDAKDGTVYYDSSANTLKINGGDTIDLTDNYSTEFTDNLAVIDILNAGDVVTLDGDTISIDLGAASNTTTINFADTVKDKVVNINGKGYSCVLEIASTGKAKELKLSGSNSKFDIDDVNAEKISLNKDVVVEGDNTVSILPGTVIVNGVKVTTKFETKIVTTSADKTLNVTVNGTVNNDLVFENLTDSNIAVTDAIINFVGDGTYKGQQLGTIVIKTNNGKVTVTSTDINVDSKLNVEVNKGQVDIKDDALTGSKNISVTHKDTEAATTIEVKLANKAPFKTTSTYTVDVKQYKLEDTVKDSNNSAVVPEGENTMEDVVKFLNSFNLSSDAKATIATTDGETIKLTISGDVTNYSIPSALLNK